MWKLHPSWQINYLLFFFHLESRLQGNMASWGRILLPLLGEWRNAGAWCRSTAIGVCEPQRTIRTRLYQTYRLLRVVTSKNLQQYEYSTIRAYQQLCIYFSLIIFSHVYYFYPSSTIIFSQDVDINLAATQSVWARHELLLGSGSEGLCWVVSQHCIGTRPTIAAATGASSPSISLLLLQRSRCRALTSSAVRRGQSSLSVSLRTFDVEILESSLLYPHFTSDLLRVIEAKYFIRCNKLAVIYSHEKLICSGDFIDECNLWAWWEGA